VCHTFAAVHLGPPPRLRLPAWGVQRGLAGIRIAEQLHQPYGTVRLEGGLELPLPRVALQGLLRLGPHGRRNAPHIRLYTEAKPFLLLGFLCWFTINNANISCHSLSHMLRENYLTSHNSFRLRRFPNLVYHKLCPPMYSCLPHVSTVLVCLS
jgi:hypothetical protein